jgi:outer membrane protein OmpA-like peptidoglycan-associated protein
LSHRQRFPNQAAPAVSDEQLISTVDIERSIFFARRSTAVNPAEALPNSGSKRSACWPTRSWWWTLVGHTDDLGSASYNLAIAEQRVSSVYQLLRKHGVPRKQLLRYAVGREKVARACGSRECRAKMRRVEFVYPQ